MTRGILLASIVALVLAITPRAFAAEINATSTDTIPAATVRSGETDTDILAASNAPNPSLAMASASVSNDGLANFGPSSGTVVGNRALELRDSILRLRASVNLNSNEFAVLRSTGAAGAVQYHSTVAAITARLQNGTTKGNPILLRQWDEANNSLDEVSTSLGRLNTLQTAVEADASMASYLLQSIQAAFELSGAIDEDHDQLKLLHDEDSRLIVQLDYLRNQTSSDIERQTNYMTTERNNLQTLAFAISRGELLGNSVASRPVIVNTPPIVSIPGGAVTMSPREYMAESAPLPTQVAVAGAVAPSVGRLLVLIRYNQPHVDYEQQLSTAVGTAVERRPNAMFSVVAVVPASGDPADLAQAQQDARRDAEAVKRSLIQMGLSPSHISMASAQVQAAQTPEVHVYVR